LRILSPNGASKTIWFRRLIMRKHRQLRQPGFISNRSDGLPQGDMFSWVNKKSRTFPRPLYAEETGRLSNRRKFHSGASRSLSLTKK
jgi:hypothetical protein